MVLLQSFVAHATQKQPKPAIAQNFTLASALELQQWHDKSIFLKIEDRGTFLCVDQNNPQVIDEANFDSNKKQNCEFKLECFSLAIAKIGLRAVGLQTQPFLEVKNNQVIPQQVKEQRTTEASRWFQLFKKKNTHTYVLMSCHNQKYLVKNAPQLNKQTFVANAASPDAATLFSIKMEQKSLPPLPTPQPATVPQTILYGLTDDGSLYYRDDASQEWIFVDKGSRGRSHVAAGLGRLFVISSGLDYGFSKISGRFRPLTDTLLRNRNAVSLSNPKGSEWIPYFDDGDYGVFTAIAAGMYIIIIKNTKWYNPLFDEKRDKPFLEAMMYIMDNQAWLKFQTDTAFICASDRVSPISGEAFYSVAAGLTTNDVFRIGRWEKKGILKPRAFQCGAIYCGQVVSEGGLTVKQWKDISKPTTNCFDKPKGCSLDDKAVYQSNDEPKQIVAGVDCLFAVTRDNKIYFLDSPSKAQVGNYEGRTVATGWVDIDEKNKQVLDLHNPYLAVGRRDIEYGAEKRYSNEIFLLDRDGQRCRIWMRQGVGPQARYKYGSKWKKIYDTSELAPSVQRISFKEIAVYSCK
jgi:hypothetical protein